MHTGFKVLLTIIGCVLGLIILVAVSGYFFLQTAEEVEISETEKTLLLTPVDMVEFFDGFEVDEEALSFTKTVYIDNTYDLEAEYDSYNENHPYMNCTITVERKLSDAKSVYTSAILVTKGSIKYLDGDSRTIEMEGLAYGDQSKFYLFKKSTGDAWGNAFIVRKKKTICDCFISNFYFDDPESFEEMLAPKLEQFLEHDFSKVQ